MSCIWNGNLHRWRVNRGNRYCQKQFLHLDHWIQQKSRECNEHILSVVRLRFGSVAATLNNLMDLLWRIISASCTTMWTTDKHLITIILSHLKKHVHMAHANGSMNMCHLLLIKYHLDPFTLLLSTVNINLRCMMHIVSFHDSTHPTYLKKILHYGCYPLLAICWRIFYMVCSSHSTTIWDSRPRASTFSTAIEWGFHSLLLQHLCPAVKKYIKRSIIQSLHDQLKWHLWMGTFPRRWRLWQWEWMLKYSHSHT